jgi:ferredoxin
MHCLSCNVILTDSEASLKYNNHEEISNPEDKYIGLCSRCLKDSDLNTYHTDVDEFEEIEIEIIEGDCI